MEQNQLKPELLGLTGANSFSFHNSSSRSVMMGSHMTQSLRTLESDEKRIQSGIEQELSKTTFDVKMPANGTVLEIINKYPASLAKDSLKFNPETIVIFEREDDGQIDMLVLPYYCSHHQYFGFQYKPTENMRKLVVNTPIAKDTVFATSPAVSENNGYKYGLNFNTAFMSIPAVAEDGFAISKTAIERLKFKVYERRSVEFGSKNIPLNIHGNSEEYKMFPDIGEYTNDARNDGLLMMLREVSDELAPALMSKDALREPDFTFDKGVYVRAGRGKVIDIKVTSNNNHARNIPPEITEQLSKYEKANYSFYNQLLELESSLLKRKRSKYGLDSRLNLSPRLHALLVEAYAVTNTPHSKDRQPLNLLYRQDKIDEYRIDFVIEYSELRANIASKLTTMSGGK